MNKDEIFKILSTFIGLLIYFLNFCGDQAVILMDLHLHFVLLAPKIVAGVVLSYENTRTKIPAKPHTTGEIVRQHF